MIWRLRLGPDWFYVYVLLEFQSGVHPFMAARLSTYLDLRNCTRMESLAEPLYRAGVRRLNVSLDSLRPEVFKQVTGGDLDKVLRGIAAARAVGFAPIRVNTVVMRGVNDAEIEDILGYCADNAFTLRLIETMPAGGWRLSSPP